MSVMQRRVVRHKFNGILEELAIFYIYSENNYVN
jgi:hypothetical protein